MIRISFAIAAAAVALSAAPSFADNDDCNSCRTKDGWQIVSARQAPQPQHFFLQANTDMRFTTVTQSQVSNTTADACTAISAGAPQEQISVCDSLDR
jgi:hypothetical protein